MHCDAHAHGCTAHARVHVHVCRGRRRSIWREKADKDAAKKRKSQLSFETLDRQMALIIAELAALRKERSEPNRTATPSGRSTTTPSRCVHLSERSFGLFSSSRVSETQRESGWV